jgi:molybdopterin adenylyltransferase
VPQPEPIPVVPPLPPRRHATVITISDRCARGETTDLSGPAVAALLTGNSSPAYSDHSSSGPYAPGSPESAPPDTFLVIHQLVVPDEQPAIEDALRHAVQYAALVVTTGGTGLTQRDVTPEATRAVCTRLLDGLSEQMRREGLSETPFAVLSRGVCGLLGHSLIVNLPGSPRGAVTSLRAILPVLPHAVRLLVDPAAPHPQTHPETHPEAQSVAPTSRPGPTGSPA